MSFLCWGLQRWTHYSRWASWEQSKGAESPPSTYWPRFSWCSPGYGWPSGLQAHFVGSCWASHPPVPSSPSSQGCSQATLRWPVLVICDYQQAFLDPSSLQGCISRNSSKQISEEGQVCSLEIQCCVLLFAMLPFLWTLNSTSLWSLPPSQCPASMSPTSSFFVSMRFRGALFLVGSLITRTRKLSTMHSRFHCQRTLVYLYFCGLLLC